MTPAARVQAAIELLDLIIAAINANGQAADFVVAEWFRDKRFIGSGDRRAIRELVYRVIRNFGDVPATGRSAMVALAGIDPEIAAAFDGSVYGPKLLVPGEPEAELSIMPTWLGSLIDESEHHGLMARAPTDVRVNILKTTVKAMASELSGAEYVKGLPNALRIDQPVPQEITDFTRLGFIEIQDAGSQWVALACKAQPSQTVIDLCAGGGGKTLALAVDMQNRGRLIACDVDRSRIAAIEPRKARTQIAIESRLLDGGREAEMLADLNGGADVVLVDAPCTGSGTIRRNPEARWRINQVRLDKAVALQRHVLGLAMPLVRPGGALVYAVCSLIAREGRIQIEHLLTENPGWTAEPPFEGAGRVDGPGRFLTPAYDQTDGFFVARLIRAC